MENTFKLGDRVQTHTGVIFGHITKIETVTNYHIRDEEDGHTYIKEAEDLEYKRLSPEDAWIEAALLVGSEVYNRIQEPCFRCVLTEHDTREIRHRAYQILGGSGIKVDEPVKARVRGLIERAKSMHERG